MEQLYCRFCGRKCKNANSLRNHERLCKSSPGRDILPPKTDAWYAAMARPGSHSNQYIKARKLGLPKPVMSEATRAALASTSKRIMPEEEKQRRSAAMKKVYAGRCIWATQLEKRKSYAEAYFDAIFPDAKQNYHVLRYFLDLAWPDSSCYIEIDGSQHYTDPGVIAHDIERTKLLAENGWTLVARVNWAQYKKLSREAQEDYVLNLKSLVDTHTRERIPSFL